MMAAFKALVRCRLGECGGDVVRVVGVRPSFAFRRSGACGIATREARFVDARLRCCR